MENNEKIQISKRNVYLPGYTQEEQKNSLCCLYSCGRLVCTQHYLTDRRDYNMFLFYYVVHGKSFLEYDGQKHTLEKGQAFLIDCNNHQVYGSDKEDPCTILYAHFDGGCSRFLYDKIVAEKGYVFSGFDSDIIHSGIISLTKNTGSSSKYKIEKLSSIIYHMLQNLLTLNAKEDSPFDIAAEVARRCIFDNRSINVEDMAQSVGYSKFYFTKRFTAHFGISPYEFILKEKIDLCKYKLINSNNSVSNIAHECGFFDASHMSNCFKKRESVSPLKFRREWEKR